MPKQPSEESARIKKAAHEGRIRCAPTDEITALQPYVARILAAMAGVLANPDITEALVTDLSMLSDFVELGTSREAREAQMRELAMALGVAVEPLGKTLLYEVARELAQREDSTK